MKNGGTPTPTTTTTTTSSNSDIRPAKSKADAVDVAPVRPSKQQLKEAVAAAPLKVKETTAAASAVEDFPTLGEMDFYRYVLVLVGLADEIAHSCSDLSVVSQLAVRYLPNYRLA